MVQDWPQQLGRALGREGLLQDCDLQVQGQLSVQPADRERLQLGRPRWMEGCRGAGLRHHEGRDLCRCQALGSFLEQLPRLPSWGVPDGWQDAEELGFGTMKDETSADVKPWAASQSSFPGLQLSAAKWTRPLLMSSAEQLRRAASQLPS